MRAQVWSGVLLVLALGCQPSGGPSVAVTSPPAGAASDPIGAPDSGLPRDLPSLLQRGQQVADQWQDEPVLAEVEVDLDPEGRWVDLRLLYLAGDADRMLQLTGAGDGFSQERPSLATLQIAPVPATALAELPAFPDDALPPQELVASEAVAECGIAGTTTVLYATGAPVAWNGSAWSSPPQWHGLITGADDAGVRVDVVSGAADGCID